MNKLLKIPLMLTRLIIQSALLALNQIWVNKTRSLLTTLGIIIGIVAVVLTMTAANGLQNTFRQSFSSVGADATAWLTAGYRPLEALAWIGAGHQGKRPFLWVHYFDPHLPYTSPLAGLPELRDDPYAAEIAYADQQLGRLIDWLEREDLARRTLVIVTSDHGESLGEQVGVAEQAIRDQPLDGVSDYVLGVSLRRQLAG